MAGHEKNGSPRHNGSRSSVDQETLRLLTLCVEERARLTAERKHLLVEWEAGKASLKEAKRELDSYYESKLKENSAHRKQMGNKALGEKFDMAPGTIRSITGPSD